MADVGTALPVLPPTPAASDAHARRAMQRNRRSDTRPERALRSLLHRAGLRYRKDHALRLKAATVRPDIVFTRARLAVFIDGCFWHGCPNHGRMPRRNRDYWEAKIGRNRARDRRVDGALAAEGWRVVRLWEHVPPAEAAQRVIAELQSARQR